MAIGGTKTWELDQIGVGQNSYSMAFFNRLNTNTSQATNSIKAQQIPASKHYIMPHM